MFLHLDNLDEAVNKIEENEIVGIPTETVYGIGVNPNSETAVDNLVQQRLGKNFSAGKHQSRGRGTTSRYPFQIMTNYGLGRRNCRVRVLAMKIFDELGK
mgnify:CR=1 FL=1